MTNWDVPQERGYHDLFLDPDWFKEDKDSICFIYDNRTQKMFLGDGFTSHGILIGKHDDELSLEDYTRRGGTDVLYGRVGIDERWRMIVISFWNPESIKDPVYRHLGKVIEDLGEGIRKLQEKYPDHQVSVSMPSEGTFPASKVESVPARKEPLTSRERYEKMKRFHLAHGEERKRLMKDLGLGFSTQAEHPVSKEMKRLGMIGPGMKWWAPYSEGLKRAADQLLEGEDSPEWWRNEHIDPDALRRRRYSSIFLYFNDQGELFVEPGYETHSGMVEKNHLEDRLENDSQGTLMGRLGAMGSWESNYAIVISLWNNEDMSSPVFSNFGDFLHQLDPYIELLRRRYPGAPVVLSTPAGTVPVKELSSMKKATPEKIQRAEKMRRMHLARGEEKKRLMRELGVGFDPSHDPHPFITRFKQVTGQAFPPYSESLDTLVDKLIQ